jgi:hypothetical protein
MEKQKTKILLKKLKMKIKMQKPNVSASKSGTFKAKKFVIDNFFYARNLPEYGYKAFNFKKDGREFVSIRFEDRKEPVWVCSKYFFDKNFTKAS